MIVTEERGSSGAPFFDGLTVMRPAECIANWVNPSFAIENERILG